MCHKYRFIIATITLLVWSISYTAIGAFGDWQPFVVREDLVALKMEQKKVPPPASVLEGYIPDNKSQSNTITIYDERSKRWNEFQFKSFRLRISRYNDLRIKSFTVPSNNTDNNWELIKSLPGQMGNSSYRETLEAMGKIFAPQLDLGIEF